MAKLIDPCRGHSMRVVAVTIPIYRGGMDDFLVIDGGRAMLLHRGPGLRQPTANAKLRGYRDGERAC